MHSASMRGQMATMGRSSSAPTSPQMSSKRSSMFLSSLFGSSILQAPPTTPTTRPTQEPPISGAQVSPAAYTTQIRLRNDLLALMNDYNSADTTVIVGDDQVEFHSHRIMLIARSDYFRRLFQSGTQERVILSHLDPDAFRIVRRFLYTAEEEDEATSPTTDDWRLVLEAYRVTEYLGVHERSPAYHACFVNIFHRLAMELHDRETCREMWVAAEGYGLDNLLVGCAPYFWVMFGTGSNGGSGHGTGSEDLWGSLVDV
ncbi:hypothetical protein BC829DRAFT_68933 [Chytridium lagenaria]|nr:hypothetical protein BC829DRAFT_68933 [Chytridium lagenaria]